MSPEASFVSLLLLTLALLGGVVRTGLAARRRTHLTLVACAILSLAATVVCAERLGRFYDLQAAGWITPFHLALAKLTAAAYVLPIATGILTLRRPARRRLHRRMAWIVLSLTAAAAVTGTIMLLRAERLP